MQSPQSLLRRLQPNPPQREKNGRYKKAEGKREAQNCLQITKGELKPFLTTLGTRMRAKGRARDDKKHY